MKDPCPSSSLANGAVPPSAAKPALRRGKKWCSQHCCLAAYVSRKRAAREAQNEVGR